MRRMRVVKGRVCCLMLVVVVSRDVVSGALMAYHVAQARRHGEQQPPPPSALPAPPRAPKFPPASFCFLLRTQVVLLNVQDDISKDAVNAALDRYLRRKMVQPHPPFPAHHPSLFIRFSTKRMK